MNIEKRRLGNTGLEVTRLGFGALEIGRDWGVGDAAATQRPDAVLLLGPRDHFDLHDEKVGTSGFLHVSHP